MPDWLPIGMVPEVHNFLSQTPPPLPASFLTQHQPSSPPPLQSPHSKNSSSTPQQKITLRLLSNHKKTWWVLASGVSVAVLAAIFFFLKSNTSNANPNVSAPTSQSPYQPTQNSFSSDISGQDASSAAARLEATAELARREAAQKEAQKQAALERREAKREWHRQHFLEYVAASIPAGYSIGLMGGISNGHVLFVNNSGYRLSSAVAAIAYIKPSGEVHETRYVTFGEIGPHSSAMYVIPNSNRGVRVSATIYRVDVPGLNYSYDKQGAEDAETAKSDYLVNH